MRPNVLLCRNSASWIMIVLLFLFLQPNAVADGTSASVSITVVDLSGAFIPDASMVIRNTDTNQEQRANSGKAGSGHFTYLKPGHYKLIISKPGFADLAVDNILLNIGDEKLLELVLKVGSANQTVTVDGSGLTINTTDASVSTVIDGTSVANMPLNGRSFQDLISMTPGVVTQSPQTGSGKLSNGDFSINGQRTESNYYTVDGVAANTSAGPGGGTASAATGGSVASSTALGTTQSLVSVDALQEFRVASSTYSAEYGRAPGGQISFLTRSGTNSLHGTAYDYLRNNYFDANDWFNDHVSKPITALRQNDFGGTLGGPIQVPTLYSGINKSFFFFSYEGLRLLQPQATTVKYVPDSYLRQNSVAAMQPILNTFPVQNGNEELVACTQGATSNYPCPLGVPTGTRIQSGLADFIQSYSLPSDINSTSVRIDHTFLHNTTVFFRFANTPSNSDTRMLSSLGTTAAMNRSYTAGANAQMTDHLSNETRYGYTTSLVRSSYSLDTFGGAAPVDLPGTIAHGLTSPSFVVPLITFPGVGSSYIEAGGTSNSQTQWNLVNAISWTSANHVLKFGVDYRHIRSPLYSPLIESYLEKPSDVLTGIPSLNYVIASVQATPIFQEFAAYGQDSWRVIPSLTLSLGLRWEVNPAPTGANGKDAYTISGSLAVPSSLSIAPRGTPLWNTTWFNFAPRFGAAWQAHSIPGWETVFRGGGGVFFDTDNQEGAAGFSGYGFSATGIYSGTTLPLTASQVNISPSSNPPYSSVYMFPTHLQLPYSFQWNASIEQALGKSQSVTMSYVGANGRRQLGQEDLPAPNSNFSTIGEYIGGLSSSYNALQIKFQRSVRHGIQVLGSYTWAHSIDEASTYISFLPVRRGSSDFDVRNNFSAGAGWDLPVAGENALLRVVTNGWAVDGRFVGRTGFPVSLQGSFITDPITGTLNYGGVNLIPNQPIYLYGDQYPGGRAVNKATFSAPAGVTVGDAPRNLVRGFGETQFNLAARREIAMREAVKLQFRAEVFNLFNHPNFGYVDPILADATFGQATKMLDQSLGTVAPQYQQGGPRSMQFALKLQF
ncbi:TonB-dependent receptor [Granulicella sibirica]|uniref:Oar protein n=1 Tax=Granulicella sibirica TaxID=2479048 RepID=A0A4Q0SSI4_9BACT|nr:carboxypeptidase regulatory-like domain-containing protein [Granulicella sibirica]RXH53875.1 Oar protein [Granulicella sibirica]